MRNPAKKGSCGIQKLYKKHKSKSQIQIFEVIAVTHEMNKAKQNFIFLLCSKITPKRISGD